MAAAKKAYTYQAIQDVLELLDHINETVALHRAQDTQDTLAIAGYERQREQLLGQLAKLLVPFGVEVVHSPTAT